MGTMNPTITFSKSESDSLSPDLSAVDDAADKFRKHGALFLQSAFPRELIERAADAFAAVSYTHLTLPTKA